MIKRNFLCIPNQRLALEKSVREIEALGVAINGAREITNEPGGVITPEALARHAKKLAANSYKRGKLTCRILNEKALKKWGYNGLLTVGAGAPYPPRLIALTYKPAKGVGNVHLCVVGKGVTFDTGGVCLKKPKQMWEMKTDMAGAASALHTAEAAARLSIPAKITAIVPAAQNTIGANAALPGTIFRAKNGKTIHVDNTDAEGRLILTDAFALAESLKPTHLVDLATLTGSCILALGTSLTGLLGDNHDFNKTFLEIAEAVGEPCWELPLFEEYKKHLKCDFADINNIANTPNAGAISAALFLAEFKPKDVPWIHLDIAGTAMAEKEWKYFRPGATGVGIRSLVRLARHLARR